MSDIFISYARADREKAKAMAEALERQRYRVWWDPKIPPGKRYDEIIERALSEARCVVVLWSRESIGRDWVKEEASVGLDRGILLPVKIEPVNPPLGFRRIQAADLTDWTPGEPHQGFSLLLDAIAEVAGAPSENKTGQWLTAESGTDSRVPEEEPDFERVFTNIIGMEFALIPAGTFTMGSRLSPEEVARRLPRASGCVSSALTHRNSRIAVKTVRWRAYLGIMFNSSSRISTRLKTQNSTGSPVRRSGSMPAGPAAILSIFSVTTSVDWTNLPGTRKIQTTKPILWERRSPTVSVSTTCTATCGSGLKMTGITAMRVLLVTAHRGLTSPGAPAEWFAAAAGTTVVLIPGRRHVTPLQTTATAA